MPNAPFLAPERDSAFKRGRAKGNSVTYYSIPGVVFSTTSTQTLILNIDVYAPFFVETPLLIDQAAAEVTTLNVGQNFRMGIYAADTDWQPVGAPLMDSGDISMTTTGVKTYTPGTPLYLPRGRYLEVMNASASSNGFRSLRGFVPGSAVDTGWSGSPFIAKTTVGRTYAAFPTPGTAWTTVATTADGCWYQMAFRVSAP